MFSGLFIAIGGIILLTFISIFFKDIDYSSYSSLIQVGLWFLLFSYNLYLVKSNGGKIMAVNSGFMMILVSIVVVLACVQVFYKHSLLNIMFFTFIITSLGYQLYTRFYRPWW